MVQSLNNQSDLVVKGTAFLGMAEYGKIMIGNQAFEFYSDRSPNKFIQIPWDEVKLVKASVMFKGHWIPRFSIITKKDGQFIFAAQKPKEVLRKMNQYIPTEQMVHSLSFFDNITRGLKGTFKKK